MPLPARDMRDRFWEKVDLSGECWLWTACVNHWGYGKYMTRKGRIELAHRVAWELEHAEPIPTDRYCLHHCDTPACVRPDHLYIGTIADNMRDVSARRRMPHARKTHCKHGHPFDLKNTILRAGGRRGCRACGRASTARYVAKKRAEAGLTPPP